MFAEFRRPLWIVAVDFRKAFDSVNHDNLWAAMLEQGVPKTYVQFLRKLYDGQSGQVQTDCLSKRFDIGRGTRQGDPISPILFNSALEDLMRKLTSKWSQSRDHGIQIRSRKLTNLRFADDLLLCASSFRAARAMLIDLMEDAAKYGLEVHESKTKFLWNGHGERVAAKETSVQCRPFEILDEGGSTMYLGRLFSFFKTHDVELKNRINKCWAKFAMFRSELTSRSLDLERRLKLFKAVVQPTLLYGCSCWTLTREKEQLIRTTQRRMMRQIVGSRREMSNGQLEEWVDWIIRATREAEATMERYDVPDWVEEAHRRKFRWAGHVARRHDGRWTRDIRTWTVAGHRSRRRPLTRWTDSLNKFFSTMFSLERQADNSFWMDLAENRDSWRAAESDYVHFVLGS
jgi:hypothetical protein